MTVPGPNDPPTSRRAARAARAGATARADAPQVGGTTPGVHASRGEAARTLSIDTAPTPTPPIFRDPPPPLPASPSRSQAPASPEPLLEPAAVTRHARGRRARRLRIGFAAAAAAALVLGGAVAVTGAVTAPPVSELQAYRITGSVTPPPEVPVDASVPPPAQISALPAPTFQDAAPAGVDLCAMPAFSAALAAHDDAAAITAAGGADAFRAAIATGTAPCVPLNDPSHVWVVVNKLRPFDPLDYVPKPLGLPNGVRSLEGGELRTDAATGLATMVAAAKQAGVGEIALESGYRSYVTQKKNFGSGGASVEASVARPGYSEHQSGLAGDLVACANGCGTLDAVAATPQGQWLTAHSWEYGWIVRYEEGRTATTGYIPEAWHFRYIGVDLARAYHGGSWHTLEEFFGLPAAPDYAN